jgi:hypothetical protein
MNLTFRHAARMADASSKLHPAALRWSRADARPRGAALPEETR